MAITELLPEWDESNENHIARHGISPEEVEEVVFEDFAPSIVFERQRRARKGEIRWIMLGKTGGGRLLFVVIAPRPEKGYWRCVTAREMTRKQKQVYRHRYEQRESGMPSKKDNTHGFKSEADEAAWWDEHDFLDYPDEFREVDIQIRRSPKITLSIRLPSEQINLLKRFGRRRNLGHTQLAAMWLAERIAIEKRRSEERRKISSG